MKQTDKTGKIIEKDGRRYREKICRSALPFWAAAGVWLISALFLPMYNMLHLIGIALVSLGAGDIENEIGKIKEILKNR